MELIIAYSLINSLRKAKIHTMSERLSRIDEETVIKIKRLALLEDEIPRRIKMVGLSLVPQVALVGSLAVAFVSRTEPSLPTILAAGASGITLAMYQMYGSMRTVEAMFKKTAIENELKNGSDAYLQEKPKRENLKLGHYDGELESIDEVKGQLPDVSSLRING